MTLNLPAAIGSNAGAAENAARLRALADDAIRRTAFAPATANADCRDHRPAVREDRAASRVPVAGDAESRRYDQTAASGERSLRRGANPLFVAQMLAQGAEDAAPARISADRAAAAYPSLTFDNDIFLPGEDISFRPAGPRIDIHV